MLSISTVIFLVSCALIANYFIKNLFYPPMPEGMNPLGYYDVYNLPHQSTGEDRYGNRVLEGQAPFFMNWMDPDQLYDVDVYVSLKNPSEFFGDQRNQRVKPAIFKSEPVWSLKGITYSLEEEYNPPRNKTIDLDMKVLEKDVLGPKNQTLWVHTRLKTENPLHRKTLTHPRHQ